MCRPSLTTSHASGSKSKAETALPREAVQALEDAVNDKYHLKDLIHKAAATVGYMGGAFIFIDTGAEGADLELPLRISSLSAEMSLNMDLSFVLVDPVSVTPGDYNSGNPAEG